MKDIEYLQIKTEKQISQPEVRVALNLAYINSEGEIVDKTIKEIKRDEHYYESVTYSNKWVPSNTTKFFSSLYSLDVKHSVQPFYLWVGG